MAIPICSVLKNKIQSMKENEKNSYLSKISLALATMPQEQPIFQLEYLKYKELYYNLFYEQLAYKETTKEKTAKIPIVAYVRIL